MDWEETTAATPFAEWQVVGGTGAHAGATGTAEMRVTNSNVLEVWLELACE